jgi:hypothetical protein
MLAINSVDFNSTSGNVFSIEKYSAFVINATIVAKNENPSIAQSNK